MYPIEQRQARLRYIQHKHSVKQRLPDKNGNTIEFRLTFEEWWDIWLKSGFWHLRGRYNGNYCMARYGDIGHYEVGNVYIAPIEKNVADAHIGNKASNLCKQRTSQANSKPIMTPAGVFPSRRAAGKHFGISPEGIGVRLKSKPQEYYYL